jgi:hypothetical protein
VYLLTPPIPLCTEAAADIVGGSSVASLGARLRPEAWKPLEEELMALSDRSWERWVNDCSGTSVAGEAFSFDAEKLSTVFDRAGVIGMSTVISGRVGREELGSRLCALFDCEDAMFNRQHMVSVNVQ